MANYPTGPLALPATEEPLANSQLQPTPQEMQARQAGAVPLNRRPAVPQQPQFQGFSAPGGQNQLNQIYGLLAQYSDDPSQIGQNYVQAIQQQQRLSRENQPMDQWLRIYGKVNPHDYTPQSIQAFHNNLVETGTIRHELLEERERLSDTETKMLAEADHEAQTLSFNMMKAHELSLEYEDMHRRGVSGGLVADVKRWLNEKMGREDDDDLVYRQFDELKNSSVIQNLPPGIASDTDIALALRGWPPATASPAHLTAFLRGRQKMMAIQHAAKTHESYFLSKNRTRAGLAQHWNKNKDYYVIDALERFGGVRRPTNADGSFMTPDQAAEHYLANKQMMGQPGQQGLPQIVLPMDDQPQVQAQPSYRRPSAAQSSAPETSDEDVLKGYGIQ